MIQVKESENYLFQHNIISFQVPFHHSNKKFMPNFLTSSISFVSRKDTKNIPKITIYISFISQVKKVVCKSLRLFERSEK